MRGEICAEPVEHFFTPQGTNPWSIFPTIETLVWDVRNAPWKRPIEGATARDLRGSDSAANIGTTPADLRKAQ
jgi:hypothetical protein